MLFNIDAYLARNILGSEREREWEREKKRKKICILLQKILRLEHTLIRALFTGILWSRSAFERPTRAWQ